jgi:hypothetical protein
MQGYTHAPFVRIELPPGQVPASAENSSFEVNANWIIKFQNS